MAAYLLSEGYKNQIDSLLKKPTGSMTPHTLPSRRENRSPEAFSLGRLFDCGLIPGLQVGTDCKLTVADGSYVFTDPDTQAIVLFAVPETELDIAVAEGYHYHQIYLAFDAVSETDIIHVVQAASLNDFSYVDTSKKYFMLMYSIEMEGAVFTRHLPRFRWASGNGASASEEEPSEEPSGDTPPPCGHPGNEPGAGGGSDEGDDTDHPGDEDTIEGNTDDHPGDGEGEDGVTPECGDPT